MKNKKIVGYIGLIVCIFLVVCSTFMFISCSSTNANINSNLNNSNSSNTIDTFVSIYPEEEKAIDKTIKVHERVNGAEATYSITCENILSQDIIGKMWFYLSDGTISKVPIEIESKTVYNSSGRWGFGSRRVKEVHIKIEELVDSCKRATENLEVRISYYPLAVGLIENKVELHNRRNQLVRVELVLQYPNNVRKSDKLYLKPFQGITRTYKESAKAVLYAHVIEVGNESAEKEIEKTLKVSYKTLSDGNTETSISFTDILQGEVQFEIVRSDGNIEKVDTFTFVSVYNDIVQRKYVDTFKPTSFKIKIIGFN